MRTVPKPPNTEIVKNKPSNGVLQHNFGIHLNPIALQFSNIIFH